MFVSLVLEGLDLDHLPSVRVRPLSLAPRDPRVLDRIWYEVTFGQDKDHLLLRRERGDVVLEGRGKVQWRAADVEEDEQDRGLREGGEDNQRSLQSSDLRNRERLPSRSSAKAVARLEDWSRRMLKRGEQGESVSTIGRHPVGG